MAGQAALAHQGRGLDGDKSGRHLRRGRDSNPRYAEETYNGFRDQQLYRSIPLG